MERTYSTLTASDGTQASGSVVQHTYHSATQVVVERYKTGLEWDRVLTDIRDFPLSWLFQVVMLPSWKENAYDVGLQYFDHCFHKHVDPTEQFL